jgi:hypothetical protein
VGDWSDADRDAVRDRVERLIAQLPGVEVEDASGHRGYAVRGRRFAWFLVDHHGDDRLTLSMRAPPGVQESLVTGRSDAYFVPSYVGSRGWVAADLDPKGPCDWDELGMLLEQAWRMTAPRRLVTSYDDRP